MSRKQQLYAAIRLDLDRDGPLHERISVTKVVLDLATAEQETQRLNQLNGNKGAQYFWQATRLEPRSTSIGDEESSNPTISERLRRIGEECAPKLKSVPDHDQLLYGEDGLPESD